MGLPNGFANALVGCDSAQAPAAKAPAPPIKKSRREDVMDPPCSWTGGTIVSEFSALAPTERRGRAAHESQRREGCQRRPDQSSATRMESLGLAGSYLMLAG